MNNQNDNWHLVGSTENVDIEDIIRFDHAYGRVEER